METLRQGGWDAFRPIQNPTHEAFQPVRDATEIRAAPFGLTESRPKAVRVAGRKPSDWPPEELWAAQLLSSLVYVRSPVPMKPSLPDKMVLQ